MAWTNKKGDAVAVTMPALADSGAAKDFVANPDLMHLDFTWTIKTCAFPEFHHGPEHMEHAFLNYNTEAGDNVPQILKERAAVRGW